MECRFCGRKVNTIQYASSDNNRQQINADKANNNVSNSQGAAPEYFDMVEEHRYFCVWGQKGSESETTATSPLLMTTTPFRKLSGWEICLRHIQDRQLEVEKGWG